MSNPLAPSTPDCRHQDFVSTPIAIVVGSRNQRHKLAVRFVDEVSEYARQRQIPLDFFLFTVSDGSHTGKQNFPKAAAYLLGQ